jgi:hypothetical protein
MKRAILFAVLITSAIDSHAAEPQSREFINSEYYSYYENLVIMGRAQRPVLTYHSFSNSGWQISGAGNDHAWSGRMSCADTDAERGSGGFSAAAVDPDIYNSYNSTYPHGINDGALWQGRGFNTRLTGGAVLSASAFSLYIVPEVIYSQNRYFEIMEPGIGEYGYIYAGYAGGDTGGNPNIDYPQRFGNKPVYRLAPGQSGLRFNMGSFTAGISTENVKLGPAKINPLILSSNAEGFPHVDVGVTMIETGAGKFEGRVMSGIVQESDYYDEDKGNDIRLISFVTVAYAPSFISGLIIGINKCTVTRSEDYEAGYVYTVLNPVPVYGGYGTDMIDQRASLTMEWLLPASNFTVYIEWAREDHNSKIRNVIRDPGHSHAYTAGFSKVIPLESGNNFFVLSFELSQLIWSRDYEIFFGTGGSFYSHHLVTQGHTHDGQIMGAGIGPGANSQHLSLDYFFTGGRLGLFIFRHDRDNDPLYHKPVSYIDVEADPDLVAGVKRLNVEMNYGLSGIIFLDNADLYFKLSLGSNINRNYVERNDVVNLHGVAGLRYRL